MLYRLLRQLQYDVQYVRNFTDVDDKIIKRAAESGEEPLALAGRFITEFHTDMAALGCLPPTVSSRRHTRMDRIQQRRDMRMGATLDSTLKKG